MTEMGASSSCSDDSVRPDSDKYVNNTMTLLLKDRLFYTFLVNTLNAENICQTTDDTVTLATPNCRWFGTLIRYHHADSVCVYNTPRIDNDVELSYDDCLGYRLLKSLGAETVCREIALSRTCHLFGFMKEWLQEGGVSTDNAMGYDTDTRVQKEMMFSDADCQMYQFIISEYDDCVNRSMYMGLWKFTACMTTHFMTEMGARSSCTDDSVRHDIDTDVNNSVTLLSKNGIFYTFMVDTLGAGNICQARNDTVTIPGDCYWYIHLVKNKHVESRCTYNTPRIDNGRDLELLVYVDCLYYRFAKSLDADSVCQVSLIKKCDWYYDVVQSLAPAFICVFGLVGNLLSLGMFCSGAVDAPTAYQLQWLAGVDTTFILTWWIVGVLPDILRYYSRKYALTPYQRSVVSVLTVCVRPLSYVAPSCTVWLTVLIGLYRYLAVCQPFGKVFSHCERHGHKYVIPVVILSFLYNIPHFCEYYLHEKTVHDLWGPHDGKKYTGFSHTGLHSFAVGKLYHHSMFHNPTAAVHLFHVGKQYLTFCKA